MIDPSKYFVRKAELRDVDFLATTIIEAEKSGTGKCGMANFYEMSEEELRKCLVGMLEEEVDGCEFSLSSYLVVDYEGEAVAASGGWLEGDNEDGLPSGILKANLLHYYIPKENMLKASQKYEIIKDIQIEREMGVLQLEYSYVKKEHRGQFLLEMISTERHRIYKECHPEVRKSQYHIFENNKEMLLAVKIFKDKIVRRYVSDNPEISDYYPGNVILLIEHEIHKS